MMSNHEKQEVFQKYFADDIESAIKKLKTVEERRAVLHVIEWIVKNRESDSNFMLSSTANRGVERIEERRYKNLFRPD